MELVELWQKWSDGRSVATLQTPSEEALQDIGLLLATQVLSPEIHANRLVNALQFLSDQVKEAHGTSLSPRNKLLLQIIWHVFEGLQSAKQFIALDIASRSMLPLLLSLLGMLFSPSMPAHDSGAEQLRSEVLKFFVNLLTGYQHSPKLYVDNTDQLIQLFQLMEQWIKSTSHPDKLAVGNSIALVVCCLSHLHAGSREANSALSKHVLGCLSAYSQPTVQEIETQILDASWVPKSEKIHSLVPNVDGLWMLDENADPAISTASPRSRNAASIVLKTIKKCQGITFSAFLEDYSSEKRTIELTGAVVSNLLPNGSKMHFQGQWQQLLDANAPNAMQAPLQNWSCTVCTMSNVASTQVCSTCGSVAPVVVPNEAKINGSNPAPFQATFSGATNSFMNILWTRGEQRGVWLARRQTKRNSFNLSNVLQNVTKASVYTLHGDGSSSVVVDKAISVMGQSTVTIEFWVQPEMQQLRQVILGNGEFDVSITPQGDLIWQFGSHQLSGHVSFGEFTHVVLDWDFRELSLILNGALECQVARVKEDEERIQPKVLVIGGSPSEQVLLPKSEYNLSRHAYKADNFFTGVLLEFRMWSTTVELDLLRHRSRQPLMGNEECLLLYYPFVGDAASLLMDFGPHSNHACLYSDYHNVSSDLPPLTDLDLQLLPVPYHKWKSVNDFTFSGYASKSENALHMSGGSAVWFNEALDLSHATFQMDGSLSMIPNNSSICFAWSDVSFWSMKPLIQEVSQIESGQVLSSSTQRSLFVKLNQVENNGCNIGVYVLANKQMHCLSFCSTFSSMLSVQIKFYQGNLSIFLENKLVTLLSLDLNAVLDSNLKCCRFGAICPITPSQATVSLVNWSFFAEKNEERYVSAIRSVYGLDPPSFEEESSDKRVSCSKFHTDGSAIVQEIYGCQTCNTNIHFCKTCAVLCHDSHELVWMGKINSACGCNSRGIAACKCARPIVVIQSLNDPPFSLWCCPQCTVVNSTSLSRCSVCSSISPVSLKQDNLPSQTEFRQVEEPVEWSCTACTMLNSPSQTKCSMCDTERQKESGVAQTGTGILTLYQAAEEVKPWTCEACTMQNESKDNKCTMCGTAKASNTPALALPLALPAPTVSHEATSPVASNWLEKKSIVHEMLKSGLADIRLEEEVWETTSGLMYITYGDIFVGDIVHGDYFDSDGSLCGVLRISEDKQRMELRAKYKAAVVAQENTCFLNFNAQECLEGYWYRGDGSGVWLCKYVEANKDFRGLTDKAPFHSGLVNMQQGLTNVCYQNSFLQALFMTQAFRDQILACDKPTNPILKTLQDLFSKLLLTHNPSLATHDLQKCLLSSFQAGRQQDVCDFAHFLVDNLSNGFEEQLTRILGGTQATIIRCKSAECQHISVTREYFWELLLNMVDLRYTPITSICGVHGSSLKIPVPRKYDRLNYDLNKDRTGAPYLFFCVQRDVNADPITDIMVKVVDANEAKPTLSGYTRVEMDLNMGLGSSGGASPSKKNSPGTSTTEIRPNKKQIYLFYSKDPSGSPITDLTVIYGQDTVPDGFKVIRVDLNQGEGTKVFLCYRCDMPVTDIKLVSEGLPGYKLIDRPLQLGGKQQFLAHTDGGSLPCITSLCLIDSDEVKAKEATNWEKLNFLNDSQQHLMIQRGQGNPLYAVEVFRSPQMIPKYSDYETITLVGPKEAEQISLETLHGEWKAGDDCERSKRTVQIHHVGRNLSPSFKVTASFSKRGILQGVLQSYQAQTHVLWGSWQDSTTKHPQLVHLLFQGTNMEGTIGDGKAKCANIRGSQMSKAVSIPRPISDVFIARDGDISSLLDGMEVVSKIYGDLHLVVRRDDSECPVKEIGVIYGDIDPIPEGYECINTTIGGFNANVNQGGNVPIYICYKRDGTSALALSNISILTTSEVPDGFTKVQHTPLGMEATLVQGKSIYLSYQRLESSTPQQLLDHVLNGQYDTTMWGRMNFMVLSSIVTNEVMANCNVTAHGSSPPTVMRGLAYEVSPTMIKCVGLWEPAGTQTLLTYNGHLPQNSNVFPFELDFSIDESSKIPSTQGWWSQQNESGKWNLVKDCYVHLAYKKDYGSEWANGKLICSERVSEHSVSSMLERFGSLRTLGGEFTCSGCHQRTESSVHSVVVTPPAHLILTLKRMHYDWKLQKTCKSLHDVSFQAYLQLPALSDADRTVLKIEEGQVELPRAYGLYGVLVHSGVSANSGHYYSFCRSSASANLFLEDDPSAPWMKFNDTNVTTSSWAEMNSCVETSVSDSVYLLFYKRLDHMKPDLEEEVKSEDEEAMLLAKAMALSMSSQEAVLDSFSSSTNVLFENIQQDNSKFLLQTVANRSSQASLEELHSYLRLQNNIEEPFWTAIKSMVG